MPQVTSRDLSQELLLDTLLRLVTVYRVPETHSPRAVKLKIFPSEDGEQTQRARQRNCLEDLQRRGVEIFSERQWSESFIFVKEFRSLRFFFFYV